MEPTAQSFNAYADDYDAWYDGQVGSTLFAMEVDCLKPLLHQHKRPYLEIGAGSGRFARGLGVEYGVDPVPALLRMAESKGIRVLEAAGEELPFPDPMFGGVLIALALCFVSNPPKVLQEACRVLVPSGGLVLGLILKGSPWAEFYARKRKEGHPLYSRARFFSKAEVENLLQPSGFEVLDYRSVLLQPPGQSRYCIEGPVPVYQ